MQAFASTKGVSQDSPITANEGLSVALESTRLDVYSSAGLTIVRDEGTYGPLFFMQMGHGNAVAIGPTIPAKSILIPLGAVVSNRSRNIRMLKVPCLNVKERLNKQRNVCFLNYIRLIESLRLKIGLRPQIAL